MNRRREFYTVYTHRDTSGRWNLQQLLAPDPVWIDIIRASWINAGRRDLPIYIQYLISIVDTYSRWRCVCHLSHSSAYANSRSKCHWWIVRRCAEWNGSRNTRRHARNEKKKINKRTEDFVRSLWNQHNVKCLTVCISTDTAVWPVKSIRIVSICSSLQEKFNLFLFTSVEDQPVYGRSSGPSPGQSD